MTSSCNADVLFFSLFIINGFKFHPSLSLSLTETSPETCYVVTISATSVYHRQNKEPKNIQIISTILRTAYDAPTMTCNNADMIPRNKTHFQHNLKRNITEFVLTYDINPKDKREKFEAHICGENALQRASENFTELMDLLAFSEKTKGTLDFKIAKRSCCENQDSHFEACCKAGYTLKNGSCVFIDEKGEVLKMYNKGELKKSNCLPIRLIIVVVIASVLFIIVVMVAVVNVWRNNNRSRRHVEERVVSTDAEQSTNITAAVEDLNNPTVADYEVMNSSSFSTNVTESTCCSRASSVNDREGCRPISRAEMMFDFNKRIPKTAIMFTGTLLGSGQFGRVELANVTISGMTKKCAVKMIRGRGTNEDEKELFHELELLYQIPNHENVVSLLGGCMEADSPLYVVVEYCGKGNLLDYLKKMKHCKEYVNLTLPKLSLRWKINRALEICQGMIFLANNQIIHRDLAARNILLNEDDVAKISDFGMAKDVYLRGLYIKETAGFLPVRWMAIEAIESSIYTIKSDMWSFGVLLWELYMDGKLPYPELTDANELLDYLKKGNRMAKAENCPDTLYQLMERCWLKKPDDRPPFSQALRELENIKHAETKREESDISEGIPVFEEPEEEQQEAYGDKTFMHNTHTVGFVNYGHASSGNGGIELTNIEHSSEETTAL